MRDAREEPGSGDAAPEAVPQASELTSTPGAPNQEAGATGLPSRSRRRRTILLAGGAAAVVAALAVTLAVAAPWRAPSGAEPTTDPREEEVRAAAAAYLDALEAGDAEAALAVVDPADPARPALCPALLTSAVYGAVAERPSGAEILEVEIIEPGAPDVTPTTASDVPLARVSVLYHRGVDACSPPPTCCSCRVTRAGC